MSDHLPLLDYSRPSSAGRRGRTLGTVAAVFCGALAVALLLAGGEILRRQRQENVSLRDELMRTLIQQRATASRESALHLQERWTRQAEQDLSNLHAELAAVKAEAAAAQRTIATLQAELNAAREAAKEATAEPPPVPAASPRARAVTERRRP